MSSPDASDQDEPAENVARGPWPRRRTYAERNLPYDPTETNEEAEARESRSRFSKALKASTNYTVVMSAGEVARLDAKALALPNMANPLIQTRRDGMVEIWRIFLKRMGVYTTDEAAWHKDIVKQRMVPFLIWRLENTKPRSTREGVQGVSENGLVKARTVFGWLWLLVSSIRLYTTNPDQPDEVGVGAKLLVTEGLYLAMDNCCKALISEHGLDKSSSNKTYFGRQEIARLVYAALFAYTRRPNPQTRIQFIVFVLCCFFTGARISSMIGAHDQGRNDLDCMTVGDVRLYRKNMSTILKITIRYRKGAQYRNNTEPKTFEVDDVSRPENLFLNLPSYMITHLFWRGAFPQFTTMEELLDFEGDELVTDPNMRKQPLFLKSLAGGSGGFDPAIIACASMGTQFRDHCIAAGLPAEGVHVVRRGVVQETSGPLSTDVVSRELMGHACQKTILTVFYDKTFETVDMTSIRLMETEKYAHDPALQQRMHTKKVQLDNHRDRTVAANVAINDSRWLQNLFTQTIKEASPNLIDDDHDDDDDEDGAESTLDRIISAKTIVERAQRYQNANPLAGLNRVATHTLTQEGRQIAKDSLIDEAQDALDVWDELLGLLPDRVRYALPKDLQAPKEPPNGHKRRTLTKHLKKHVWDDENDQAMWDTAVAQYFEEVEAYHKLHKSSKRRERNEEVRELLKRPAEVTQAERAAAAEQIDLDKNDLSVPKALMDSPDADKKELARVVAPRVVVFQIDDGPSIEESEDIAELDEVISTLKKSETMSMLRMGYQPPNDPDDDTERCFDDEAPFNDRVDKSVDKTDSAISMVKATRALTLFLASAPKSPSTTVGICNLCEGFGHNNMKGLVHTRANHLALHRACHDEWYDLQILMPAGNWFFCPHCHARFATTQLCYQHCERDCTASFDFVILKSRKRIATYPRQASTLTYEERVQLGQEYLISQGFLALAEAETRNGGTVDERVFEVLRNAFPRPLELFPVQST